MSELYTYERFTPGALLGAGKNRWIRAWRLWERLFGSQAARRAGARPASPSR